LSAIGSIFFFFNTIFQSSIIIHQISLHNTRTTLIQATFSTEL